MAVTSFSDLHVSLWYVRLLKAGFMQLGHQELTPPEILDEARYMKIWYMCLQTNYMVPTLVAVPLRKQKPV